MKHVFRRIPKHRAALISLLGLLIAAGICGFLLLAHEVQQGNTRQFDQWVVHSLRQPDNPALVRGPMWVVQAAKDITALGSYTLLTLIVAAVAGLLALRHRYRAMLWVLLTSFGGAALNHFLKMHYDRPRPDVPHLVKVFSPSFPSGHTMLSTVVYLTLGAMLLRVESRRTIRVYLLGLAFFLFFVVGLSRIYLGVHYPTDVLAGWTAGLVWTLLCWSIFWFFAHGESQELEEDFPSGLGPHLEPPKTEIAPFHTLEADRVFEELSSSPSGLTSEEARKRLDRYGPNILVEEKEESIWEELLEMVEEPMVLLLIGATVLYFILGQRDDALVMLFAIVPMVAIEILQEYRTGKTLKALRRLIEPKARAIRDGREQDIHSRELVPGDLLILRAGDVVTADVRIAATNYLSVDESSLTGEAVAVEKRAGKLADQDLPITEQFNMVFAGTKVVEGEATAIVAVTGSQTQYGAIGRLTLTVKEERTPIEKKARHLTKWLAIAGGLITASIIGIGLWQGIGIVDAILRGLAAAMAAIPEELPVIYTVFLALGVWQMSRQKALVRKMAAVETLGSVTAICTDKTGTLTLGEIALERLYCNGLFSDRASSAESCREFFSLPWLANTDSERDPFEKGLKKFLNDHPGGPRTTKSWQVVQEYPFDPKKKIRSTLVGDGSSHMLLARGGPEYVLALSDLAEADRKGILEANTKLAEDGLRVIGFAYRTVETIPESRDDVEKDLIFAGLGGFRDPIRAEVPGAIRLARQSGIRVVMITGDQRETALSIAKEIGMVNRSEVLTGAEMSSVSDAELQTLIPNVNVFARVLPADKLRIVEALKARGEIVAMTGDGVNDAPALKSADIGIAMGARGTEVAREAARMVLLDDNFSTIIIAVKEGRRIFDNIQKALGYFTSMKIALLGFVTLNGLSSLPLAFFPIHIVWMELITDPTSSLVYQAEPAEPNLMKRPPRSPKTPLLPMRLLLKLSAQGMAILAGTFGIYWYEIHTGLELAAARTMAFAVLIISQIFLVLVNRSEERPLWRQSVKGNPYLAAIVPVTLALLLAIVYLPVAQSIFKTAGLSHQQWGVIWAVSALSTLWYEVVKVVLRLTSR